MDFGCDNWRLLFEIKGDLSEEMGGLWIFFNLPLSGSSRGLDFSILGIGISDGFDSSSW